MGLICLSQVNYTAYFDDLKQKKWWFEIGDLVVYFIKKLVSRMDTAPYFVEYHRASSVMKLNVIGWFHRNVANNFYFWDRQ